jgi:hypothetical protein
MAEKPQGYSGPLPAYYIQSSAPQTPNLGLTISGVDPIVAYNFVLIDNFAAGGSGVSSLNTLTGAVTLAAGSNVTITPAGNTLTIASSAGGTITGSGTANTFTLWTGPTAIGNSSIATQVANSTGNGTAFFLQSPTPASAIADIEIHNQFSGGYEAYVQAAVGNLGRTPLFSLYKSHGASLGSAPLAVVNKDVLGINEFNGYDGTTYTGQNYSGVAGGKIEVDATEDWTATAHGSAFLIVTNRNGTTNNADAFIRLAGVTSGFPAIKRVSASVNFRLADDSADTGIIASIVNATTGFQVSGSAPSGHYLRGNGTNYIDGTIQAGDLPAGTGTVTSVALATGAGAADVLYTISGSPVTTTGTLTETLNTQTANTVFAGPTSGGVASPTFRALVAADIPSGAVLWNNIGNASGALTLANAGNATTFNQTSAVNWTWANTTAATVTVPQSSPIININGTYWTGAASAADSWTIQDIVGVGTNGSSLLTFTHTGSASVASAAPIGVKIASGQLLIQANGPAGVSNPGLAFVAQTGIGLQYSASNGGALLTSSGGFFQMAFTTNQGPVIRSDIPLMWANGTNLNATITVDTSVNRFSANTVGLGTTANAADATANLALNKITRYNAVATVSGGVPAEYATVDLTAQSAAITATTAYATTATGMYRVSWSAAITTAASTSSVLGGTNGFQILYTSPTDSVVKTTVSGNSVTSAGNTTGTAVGGTEVVYAKTGTNIQYQYDYTSVGGTAMVYEIHLKVESL